MYTNLHLAQDVCVQPQHVNRKLTESKSLHGLSLQFILMLLLFKSTSLLLRSCSFPLGISTAATAVTFLLALAPALLHLQMLEKSYKSFTFFYHFKLLDIVLICRVYHVHKGHSTRCVCQLCFLYFFFCLWSLLSQHFSFSDWSRCQLCPSVTLPLYVPFQIWHLPWQFSVTPVRVGPGHIRAEGPNHPAKAMPGGHGAVAKDEEAKPMSRTRLSYRIEVASEPFCGVCLIFLLKPQPWFQLPSDSWLSTPGSKASGSKAEAGSGGALQPFLYMP